MSDSDSPASPPDNGGTADTSLIGQLRGWLSVRGRGRNGDDLRETIGELIDERVPGGEEIDADERTLLRNILNLHDRTVEDTMVPRADIVAIESETDLQGAARLMADAGHSRCPVYRGALDDTLGMVHIKDVVNHLIGDDASFDLKRILRPMIFAAPSMRVLDLLLEMRNRHIHMALVVDEFGGVDGLVTIEDLVEEIVGDIEDEHDEPELADIVERGDGTWVADARVTIEDFEEKVGPFLDDEERDELDTVGGLVFSLAGRVPVRGELIAHESGLEFEIVDADPRRIRRLRIRRRPAAAAPRD